MFPIRLFVVVVILFACLFVARLYRSWRAGQLSASPSHPRLPGHLLAGAERTWVIFTTPYCASCGPVEARLRESDPAAQVLRIDATREPLLADAFSVRSAPTVLLVDALGAVKARLVGAGAVEAYVRSPA